MNCSTRTVHELHPQEALVFLNRWAKLRDWYYDDRDTLYQIKDEFIKQWVAENQMRPTKVIERVNPTIALMKDAIANGGVNLTWLDYLTNEYHEEIECEHISVLGQLFNGWYEVALSKEELQKSQEEYEQQKIERQKLFEEISRTEEEHKRKLAIANSQLQEIAPKLKCELEKLPQNKAIKDMLKSFKKALKSGNPVGAKHIYGAINLLEQKGIRVPETQRLISREDLSKLRKELQMPAKVKAPKLTKEIDCDNYVPGSIPAIEAALQWAREKLGKPELQATDVDDYLVNYQLEDIVAEERLGELRESAIDIFQKIVSGEITDAEEAYDDLTDLYLNYEESIDMRSHTDRNNIKYHNDFGTWHKLNLSIHGYWLVEFQSLLFPEITFHVPYDRAISLGFILKNLPHDSNGEETYGREITNEEKKQYPILELLKILGKDVSSFPRKLNKYSPPVRYSYRNDDEDEDDFEDCDW